LDDLRAEDVTAMIATHDLGIAVEKFDLMLLLNHKLIAFGRPSEVMTPENLRAAFGSYMTLLADGRIVVDAH
jgi:ABC-type Mn2+/Zn2+ transport system ATPase subunit